MMSGTLLVAGVGATTVRGGQLKRALRHVFLLKTVDSGATRGQEERLAG